MAVMASEHWQQLCVTTESLYTQASTLPTPRHLLLAAIGVAYCPTALISTLTAEDESLLISAQVQLHPFVRSMPFPIRSASDACQYFGTLIQFGSSTSVHSQYALFFILGSIQRLSQEQAPSLTLDMRLGLYQTLLDFLSKQWMALPVFVQTAALQLVSLLTRLWWQDHARFRQLMQDCVSLSRVSNDHAVLALRLLTALVQVMHQPPADLTTLPQNVISQSRQVVHQFRDEQLLPIVQLSLSVLQSLLPGGDKAMKDACLTLLSSILHFDFLGVLTGPAEEETSQEIQLTQIPHSWKNLFEEPLHLSLLFEAYSHCDKSKVLSCLTLWCAVRRSLLSDKHRQRHSDAVLLGIAQLLNASASVDEEIEHGLAYLLAHLTYAFSATELCQSASFSTFFAAVFQWSQQRLNQWETNGHTLFYLLNHFWSRWVQQVSSVPSSALIEQVEDASLHLVLLFVKLRIVAPFMTGRWPSGDEEEWDEKISHLMEPIAQMASVRYERVASLLDEALGQYLTMKAFPVHFTVWSVRLVGALLVRKTLPSGWRSEAEEQWDGKLTARVIQLIQTFGLESSFLLYQRAVMLFFEQCRGHLIGSSQQQLNSVAFVALSERVGLSDASSLLEWMTRCILQQMQQAQKPPLLEESLQWLDQVSSGYSSVRLLVKMPIIQEFLRQPTLLESVPLLLKQRRYYYAFWMRILVIESEEDATRLDSFFSRLEQNLVSVTHEMVMEQCFCDLRGVLEACLTRSTYQRYFDRFFEGTMTVALRVVTSAPMEWVSLQSAVLKWLRELVLNRSQRLVFDPLSPCGWLLFRQVCQIVTTFMERLYQLPTLESPSQRDTRYKWMRVLCQILGNLLSSRLVNASVLLLYRDNCLLQCLQITLDVLMQRMDLNSIWSYQKLSVSVSSLIEMILVEYVSSCPFKRIENSKVTDMNQPNQSNHHQAPNLCDFLIQWCSLGLHASNQSRVILSICMSMESLIRLVYLERVDDALNPVGRRWRRRAQGECSLSDTDAHPFVQHIGSPLVLVEQWFIRLVLQMMQCDTSTIWGLSRPLMWLFLICSQQELMSLLDRFASSLTEQKRTLLQTCCLDLMQDLKNNDTGFGPVSSTLIMTDKKRDQFHQRWVQWKRDWVAVSGGLVKAESPIAMEEPTKSGW